MKKSLLLSIFVVLTNIAFSAEKIKVSGIVIASENNEELIGVNILVKELLTGTVSDFDGKFELFINSSDLPATLEFSYIGYTSQELTITQSTSNIEIKLVEDDNLIETVEIRGQRIEEKTIAAALTVESMDIKAIEQTASSNFYEGLGALKGVDLTSASLGIKVVNTRGFNSSAPVRILQVIDGIDNAAPSVNFAFGNFLGASELDLKSVELVVGASSAFYGPNAFNGVIKMTSNDPFYSKGLGVYAKYGSQQIKEGEIRWADAVKNKEKEDVFAYKMNFSFLDGNDWEANNYDPIFETDVPANHYGGYDAVNIYGDEADPSFDLTNAGAPWSIPGLTSFYRNGYKESDLVDYKTQNFKTSGQMSFRTKPSMDSESPHLVIGGNFVQGSTIFQGATRFRLENIRLMTAKVEYKKRNKFFVRAYMTKDNAGQSYNPFVTALKLQQRSGTNTTWASQYTSSWLSNYTQKARALGYPNIVIVDGKPTFDSQAATDFYNNPVAQDSLRSWHIATIERVNKANTAAVNPFLQPGTEAFDRAVEQINSNLSNNDDVDLGGSRLYTNSELFHVAAEYIFNPGRLDKLIVGGSGRFYTPDTRGTIFDDKEEKFTNYEFGFYSGIEEKLFKEKLTISLTGRVDKNQNFNWIATPAASIVYKPRENDYLRFSFSSAIRNPTLPDQYLNMDVGPARFLGGLNGFDSLISVEALEKYGESLDEADLDYFNVAPVRPEKVKTFELGYRSVIGQNFYFDASYYFNIYNDFIGYLIGLEVEFDEILGLPSDVDAYRITANSDNRVTTQGAALGLNFYFKKYFQLSGNYTWSKLNTQVDDEIIPAFNTPEHKFNVSLSGRDMAMKMGKLNSTNFGFNLNYKWLSSYAFEGSPQFTGMIDSYGLLDAQVNFEFTKINTTFKIGASNILNNKHYETVGGPSIGLLGYVRFTYKFDKK